MFSDYKTKRISARQNGLVKAEWITVFVKTHKTQSTTM